MVTELAERAGGRPALAAATGLSEAALASYAQQRRSPRSHNLWLLHVASEGDDPQKREARLATYVARVAAGLETFTGEPRAPRRSLTELVCEIAGADQDELGAKAAALERTEALSASLCERALEHGGEDLDDDAEEDGQVDEQTGGLLALLCG